MSHRFVFALVLAVLVAKGAVAAAGGFHISIIGGRRNAMLTNLAAPDDLTALFHNPAGLADLPGRRIHLFGSANFLSNEFELQALDPVRFPEVNPEGCGSSCPWPIADDGYYSSPISTESSFGVLPFLGFSTDLGFAHPSLESLVLSLGAYAPNLYGGAFPSDAPSRYFMTDGYFAVASLTLGLGYRFNRYVSVGGHISYNYMRMKYGFHLSMVDVLTDEGEEPDFLAETVQAAYGDVDLTYVGVDHGVGWALGVLVNPTEWMSIGLVYLDASSPRFEGDLDLRATREGTDIYEVQMYGYALPSGLVVEMPIPPALGVGVSFVPTEWLEIGLDLRLWLYNLYQHQTLRPLYDPDQTGERPMTEESLSRDKDNGVSYEVALGFLLRPVPQLRALELMLGAGYDQTPVSDESFSLDNPAMSQIIASTGLRYRVNRYVRLSAAYMFLYYLPRDVTTSETSPPTNVRGGGMNHIPSLELEVAF